MFEIETWLDPHPRQGSTCRSAGIRSLDFSQLEVPTQPSEADLSAQRLSDWKYFSMTLPELNQSQHGEGVACHSPTEVFDSLSSTGSHLSRSDSVQTSSSLSSSSSKGSKGDRYKTEMCRPYEDYGTCKYGDKCQFAHGEHELRVLSRHPKYKTDKCRTFYTTGFCPYGQRCHFIHAVKPAGLDGGSQGGVGEVTSADMVWGSSMQQMPMLDNEFGFATRNLGIHQNQVQLPQMPCQQPTAQSTRRMESCMSTTFQNSEIDSVIDLNQLLVALFSGHNDLASVLAATARPPHIPVDRSSMYSASSWGSTGTTAVSSPTKSFASSLSPTPSPTASLDQLGAVEAFELRRNCQTGVSQCPGISSPWWNEGLSNAIAL